MRTVWMALGMVLACLGVAQAQTQQSNTNLVVGGTNSTKLSDSGTIDLPQRSSLELRLNEPKDTNTLEYVVSKTTTLNVSGPLVKPLKAKSASDFGHRVFSLINPLSDETPNVPRGATGPVSTRAWSTIVGYSPGRSAFPDGAWHEPPHLDLISIRLEKKPPQP